jgi:hypothetical protein
MTTGYAGEMVDVELVDGLPLIRKPYRQDDLSPGCSKPGRARHTSRESGRSPDVRRTGE